MSIGTLFNEFNIITFSCFKFDFLKFSIDFTIFKVIFFKCKNKLGVCEKTKIFNIEYCPNSTTKY